MDWRAKVELFEQIRGEYEFGVGRIAGVAAGRTTMSHTNRTYWFHIEACDDLSALLIALYTRAHYRQMH
ncbi:MAG TPA: hypothetical protein VH302_08080 [Bryobacteraceae bacterium]|nr:hypothetical protein [Bryobacteraceae bacterium]